MARYVIANWKMHGTLERNAQFLSKLGTTLPQGVKGVNIGICVPAPYWFQLREACKNTPVAWGGQDISEHVEGAYTGEVSVGMLEDFQCGYIIIGHSERRQYHAESSGSVGRKLSRVMQSANPDIVPIVCIGEQLSDRESGNVQSVLSEQLEPILAVLRLHPARRVLLAYEPVWAIGTGVVAEPDAVRETHAWIAAHVEASLERVLPILYGGSVKADNAGALIDLPHVDGFLVGGASLKAETFVPLLECCAE